MTTSHTPSSARVLAVGSALLLAATIGPIGLATMPAATAAGVGAGLSITPDDVAHILQQIQIAEAHATKAGPASGTLVPPTSELDCSALPCITDPTLPWGLRHVDGRGNNLLLDSGPFSPTDPVLQSHLGAADRAFPRLAPAFDRVTESGTSPGIPNFVNGGGPSTYGVRGGSIEDSTPRIISNLVSDQSSANPAALSASGGGADSASNLDAPVAGGPGTVGTTRLIANIPATGLPAPGQPANPQTSGLFTLFGEFFGQGLDLVGKSMQEMVVVPLQGDDPLFVAGQPGNFLVASRTATQTVDAGVNLTTSWIDQSQTYSSHASHHVFLREYALSPVGPQDTGRLLDSAFGGYVSNWAEVKAQSAALLGIMLVDSDVANVPLLLTDEYGNFLPGPNGFPQIVLADGGSVEGNPAAPVAVPANAVRTGHAFLVDIAHAAIPTNPGYDAALLNQHFVTGDGRGNENIGVTAFHTLFHSEHNRLVSDIDSIISASPSLTAGFDAPGWTRGQRLFQAARFVNEMEYQHAVFEEYARTLAPAIRPFAAYDPTLQPDATAEFAHAVGRFGHSMLRENIQRTRLNGNDDSHSLAESFLNPGAFKTGYTDAAAAAGSIARGMNAQVSSEIDEFITSTLRNGLLGLPLDLATLDIVRGRDTQIASLNQTRAATGLPPYVSWADFAASLRQPESVVNFIAAYGIDPALQAETSVAGRRAAAAVLLSDAAFLNSPSTGLDSIDLWIGGLAERRSAASGDLLGSTFTRVFQTTLENLQESDRYFYLNRLAGLNLLSSIESNQLSEVFQRNTDADVLPAGVFFVPSLTIDLRTMPNPTPFPDPGPANGTISEGAQVAPFIRNVTYTGLLNVTVGGTSSADRIQTDQGSDTIRGGDGSDWIQGGFGTDTSVGGDGDDILLNIGGADTLVGGPGNDALRGGPNGDIMSGNSGADLLQPGAFGATASGGSGDDLELGGPGPDGLAGDAGNDWIEGGLGSDSLSGDSLAPYGVGADGNGDDVVIGGAATDLNGGGGGMDIFAGQSTIAPNGTVIPQIDDYVGGPGFDWTTYFGSRTPNADTANFAAALPAGDPGLLRDSFLDVEALSGGEFADTLNGDNRTSLDRPDSPVTDQLTAVDVTGIDGLASLLGASAAGWSTGNILVGGAGSDTINGRRGDDLIDGDAYLQVGLSIPASGETGNGSQRITVPSLSSTVPGGSQTVSQAVIAGMISPADVIAVRSIVNTTQAGDDVAVFSGSRPSYTVAQTGTDTYSVSGPDGADILRHIETLRFDDGDVPIGSGATPGDSDGVPAAVESGAPNNGDGNGDGVQDAAQANVTSLPALGSTGASGSDYVTVESPADTTLSSVAVIDPADTAVVAVPPPAGVTLPTGLVSLVLSGAGVAVGSDQTVTIFTPDTTGVVGYAKYDTATQLWTLLPDDRVTIGTGRVDIRLTDGGVGDDDGVANGTISDPGGIFTDTAAPVVVLTGVVEDRKYVIGSTPTPSCTASDAASGLAGPCAVTVAGGNAAGVGAFTATATATDKAGNTATKVAPYKVVYPWDGFDSPSVGLCRRDCPAVPVAKAGSTVEVTFTLGRVDGRQVRLRTPPTWVAPTIVGPLPSGQRGTSSNSGSTANIYRLDGRTWRYAWKTSKSMAGSLWQIGTTLDDGETHLVTIGLR